MQFTINSRNYGKPVTFYRPGTMYVYIDTTGHNPGTLGQQICEDGYIMSGEAETFFGDNQAEFEAFCRSWWRKHLAILRR
ncbi:MAG: hypothetical protein GX585_05995 [Clostridiales bacterium]|nr:hypothetical protein [Clostridiales bacterium]